GVGPKRFHAGVWVFRPLWDRAARLRDRTVKVLSHPASFRPGGSPGPRREGKAWPKFAFAKTNRWITLSAVSSAPAPGTDFWPRCASANITRNRASAGKRNPKRLARNAGKRGAEKDEPDPAVGAGYEDCTQK